MQVHDDRDVVQFSFDDITVIDIHAALDAVASHPKGRNRGASLPVVKKILTTGCVGLFCGSERYLPAVTSKARQLPCPSNGSTSSERLWWCSQSEGGYPLPFEGGIL